MTFGWPLRVTTGISLLAAVTAGCSGNDRTSEVSLPPPATSAVPTPAATSTPDSPEPAVRTAYLKYWQILQESWSVPDSELEAFLTPYVADPYLTAQVQAAKKLHTYERVTAGEYKANITSIKITEGDALNSIAYISDCQDSSKVHLIDAKTRKALPGSSGPKARGIKMTFVRTPDGWLAFRYEFDEKACA